MVDNEAPTQRREAQPPGSARATVLRLGRYAWATVGIAIAAVLGYLALAGISGLVVPLIVAAVVGSLLVPAVDRLARAMPRPVAVMTVMLALIVAAVGSVSIAVTGVVDQAGAIGEQVTAGLAGIRDWLAGLDVDLPGAEDLAAGLGELTAGWSAGLSSYVTGALGSASAFVVGTGVALFLLYYVLADWEVLSHWLGRHLGVPAELGAGMIHDATWSMRRYFAVLTVTSLVTAVVIAIGAAVVGIPLAFAIGLVTFVTSYVPYLGAFVSGTFAVLIAVGSGGPVDALVILIIVLVAQNVVQPLLNNKMTATELSLHPVVAFSSTIIGAALAGVLGATLSAPVLAMILRIRTRVRQYRAAPPPARAAGPGEAGPAAAGSPATPESAEPRGAGSPAGGGGA